MGILVRGQWVEDDLPQQTGKAGEFNRIDSRFRRWITADGSSGYKAEAGRYHLYVAWNCPWAHRTLIFRVLKGLEDAISVSYALPGIKPEGWMFDSHPNFPDCGPDTLNGFRFLHEAYSATDPDYVGKVTVPTLWDKKTRSVINNESSEIIRMLNSAFIGIAGNDKDYYPEALRAEIDEINALVYPNVNNGVYRCGFAKSQEAYEKAYDQLFATLDQLEERLGRQRYLVGDRLTEADWRLFPTLLRFDLAYFTLFRCNRQRIQDFHNLSNYMRELYRVPGIAATVKPSYYVAGYWSNKMLNPLGIIPKGTPIDLDSPHDRMRLAA